MTTLYFSEDSGFPSLFSFKWEKKWFWGDIWSRLSRLVPRPTASRLYWWSVLWKRLSIFSATKTKEKENNLTANSISVNRTWEVNVWARLGWGNPCPHTRLEMLAGVQVGMNFRIWSVLLLGTCFLVKDRLSPGPFSLSTTLHWPSWGQLHALPMASWLETYSVILSTFLCEEMTSRGCWGKWRGQWA